MIVCEQRFVLNFQLIKQRSKGLQYFFRSTNMNWLFLSRRFQSRHFVIALAFPPYALRYIHRSTFMRVYDGLCFDYNMFGMIWLLLKRFYFLQGFLCTEHENMGYFFEGINHTKVVECPGRGIYVTTTGLSLILSRADIFGRLQNRLGSQIFLVIFIRISSALDISIFSKAGLPMRKTIGAKKHLVTSTCATEKEVENQFS